MKRGIVRIKPVFKEIAMEAEEIQAQVEAGVDAGALPVGL